MLEVDGVVVVDFIIEILPLRLRLHLQWGREQSPLTKLSLTTTKTNKNIYSNLTYIFKPGCP